MTEEVAEQLRQLAAAKEIVISAHESAHAVASIRLGLRFDYVTLDDADIGPHVANVDNAPRPIPFYRGGPERCDPICENCRSEERRADSYMVMAMCGSLGAAATGAGKAFGYGHDGDKEYVVQFCKEAFGDKTDEDVNARMKGALDRAMDLMRHEGKAASAVARELREKRRLTESEVQAIVDRVGIRR
ncbi:MAG: hypothetical protein AB7P22_03380 [Vicinamibacterales bacterium]